MQLDRRSSTLFSSSSLIRHVYFDFSLPYCCHPELIFGESTLASFFKKKYYVLVAGTFIL